jgi:hypothetical protein
MKWLRLLVESLKSRQLPMIAWSRGGRSARAKCPQCKAPLEMTFGETGEPAFECPACGVRGIWTEPPERVL